MALHTDLPIYRTGVQLLALAVKVQEQMPRGVKRSLGDKISSHCVEMLDLMALANATQRADRAHHIRELMKHLRAATVLLQLADTVLMHDPRGDVELRGRPELLALVPPHKSLFNAPAGHGLPIGNLSSQFFANVLLDELDQHIKHQIRAPHYVRYVDDFILLHESPQWLNTAQQRIEAFLSGRLHLRLNQRKTILQPIARGVDFVGHVIKPWHRTTRPGTVARAIERTTHQPASDLYTSVNSTFGLFRQATHSHADRAHLANAARRRGHCVNGTFTKIFRTSTGA